MAKFDVIFGGEGVEIAKNRGEYGKREFQELFKYVIRFDIALLVAAIFSNGEAPLLCQFWPFFGIIGQLAALLIFSNLPKRCYLVSFIFVDNFKSITHQEGP